MSFKEMVKPLVPAFIWSILRSLKINHMVSNFQHYQCQRNYGGHKFNISIRDPLAKGWYDVDWKRLPEIDFLSKHSLKNGAKAFDLGAHQGIVAMMLAKEVGSNGKILGIEANQHNYLSACENIKLNNISNLQVVHAAVGETNGEIEFSDDLNGAVKNTQTTSLVHKVKSFSIDHLAQNYFKPDVIFMDIEGFEVHALKGAKEILKHKTDWFIEVHGPEMIGRFGGTVEDVLNHFPANQFDCYMADENQSFKALNMSSMLLKQRFYLIAIKK